MLKFQIEEQIYKRGHHAPHKWLTTVGGINTHSATKLLNGKQQSVKLSHLTNICAALGCSPNDLMYYEDQKKYYLPPDHALLTDLKPPPKMADWKKIIKNLSPHEAAEVFDQIQEKLEQKNQNKNAGSK